MPTTTNPTPAEIAALERRIAEEVMGWEWGGCQFRRPDCDDPECGLWLTGGTVRYACDWSPWHNPDDAMEVIKRLRDQHRNYKSGKLPDILISQAGDTWQVSLGRVFGAAEHQGDHYGPAVCLLADKILRHTRGDGWAKDLSPQESSN